jgi:hypothetical protein
LDDKQKIQYLKLSYSDVDGLWFMKTEEQYGFKQALNIDNEVWKVMPKIQARFLKSIYGLDKGIEALQRCFTEKLLMDGCEFQAETDKQKYCLRITILKCHWYDLIFKSGRDSVAQDVGNLICNTEYSGWAHEFGENIAFEFGSQICCGSKSCVLLFNQL